MRRVFLLLTIIALVSSCNKSEQTKKKLWSNGGKWIFESSEVVTTPIDNSGNANGPSVTQLENDITGSFTFNKDNYGIMSVQSDNFSYDAAFNYSATESQLIVTFLNEDIEIGSNGSNSTVFKMELDKKSLSLTTEETDYDFEEGTVKIVTTLQLKKDK